MKITNVPELVQELNNLVVAMKFLPTTSGNVDELITNLENALKIFIEKDCEKFFPEVRR